MAASAIAISSDSSDESVGSPPSQVILFGDIPTIIPSTFVVALETSTIAPVISFAAHVVETTLVASPTELCGLDPYVTTIARWRSRVTTLPSSLSEFPIAPVTAPHGIRRRSAILIRPGEAIPFGRPYCTHLNGPRKLLTARKRVGPLPARRLASRHASPRSSDHCSSSSSSSSDSSPVHSLGLDASDQAYSGSSTRDVSPRLCYLSKREPRRSEAFRHWFAAPLSTLYPPTTSESSSGDSSERPMHLSSHSAGPSRKRCRSPVDSAPLSMPVTGSLAPTRADLSPPRKRFRDSYSSEASIEEDAEVGLTGTGVDMELGIGDGDEVGDHVGIDHRDARDDTEEYEADASAGDMAEVGIDPMTAPLVEEEIVEPAGEDSPDSPGTRDGIVRSVEDTPVDLGNAVRDFYHHMSEVRVDRIVGIETAQRRLEADQLIASGDRARMAEMIYSLRLENLKVRAMRSFGQIRRDRDDARGGLRRNTVPGDKLVSWMSKKQDCTAMSSAEAEYVALSAVRRSSIMWMRKQLQDYASNYNKIPLYCDSLVAIAISLQTPVVLRTKHIHTRYLIIRNRRIGYEMFTPANLEVLTSGIADTSSTSTIISLCYSDTNDRGAVYASLKIQVILMYHNEDGNLLENNQQKILDRRLGRFYMIKLVSIGKNNEFYRSRAGKPVRRFFVLPDQCTDTKDGEGDALFQLKVGFISLICQPAHHSSSLAHIIASRFKNMKAQAK
ncbi:hypothetical protein Tco_0646888 [Tanacetum coccineum]